MHDFFFHGNSTVKEDNFPTILVNDYNEVKLKLKVLWGDTFFSFLFFFLHGNSLFAQLQWPMASISGWLLVCFCCLFITL